MPDFDRSLVHRAELPLWGRRILFCTPRNYAGKLAGLLVRRGARPVWMPTIAIEPLTDHAELDAALARLADYTWLAFTSRNGIAACLDRLAALGLGSAALRQTKLAALGNDGRALEERGLEIACWPAAATTRSLVEELRRRGENRGRILLPVPAVEDMPEPAVIPDFVDWLREAGMEPHRVPAYATRRVADGLEAEMRLLVDGAVDVVAFTSVAEIQSLLTLLGNRREVLGRCVTACYGPMTAGGAREHGLRIDIIPPDNSAFEHYVEAMEAHFRGPAGDRLAAG